MKKDKFKKSAHNTIGLQISALKKLKQSIGNSFNQAVKAIGDCKSKTIFIGVGKSQKIASLISSSLSSCAAESYSLTAEDCVHGDLGSISSKDCVVIYSKSGSTKEILPVTSYCKKLGVTIIGITSKKKSALYKAATIKMLIPDFKEGGEGGIVPSTSLITQTSIGSSIVLAVMIYKNKGVKKLKRTHPAGSISKKLLTAEDLMVPTPFISENCIMKKALKVLSEKKLGLLVARNKKGMTGLIVDGDVKRASQKNKNLHDLKVKDIMTKKPLSIDKDMLAINALKLLNKKRITSLLVRSIKKNKIIGVLHIHKVLENIQ